MTDRHGGVRESTLRIVAADGAAADLAIVEPARPCAALLWLPALGVTARNYLPFAACPPPSLAKGDRGGCERRSRE